MVSRDCEGCLEFKATFLWAPHLKISHKDRTFSTVTLWDWRASRSCSTCEGPSAGSLQHVRVVSGIARESSNKWGLREALLSRRLMLWFWAVGMLEREEQRRWRWRRRVKREWSIRWHRQKGTEFNSKFLATDCGGESEPNTRKVGRLSLGEISRWIILIISLITNKMLLINFMFF